MQKMSTFLTAIFIFLTALIPAFAESGSNPACAACGGSILFVIIAVVVINIAILVWVVKDAKARAVGSPVGWLILVLITGPLGLIIYFFSRPKGKLSPCPSCGNKRLEAMSKCPHCGN
ncbi:hypothetical protein LLG96_00190 [bacterium]|nr:hypothetical protein [bacterium]